jgi:hypothetical protein
MDRGPRNTRRRDKKNENNTHRLIYHHRHPVGSVYGRERHLGREGDLVLLLLLPSVVARGRHAHHLVVEDLTDGGLGGGGAVSNEMLYIMLGVILYADAFRGKRHE